MGIKETTRYGLIIDGLNGAELSREQMVRTRAGGVAAIQYTVIPPQMHEFEKALTKVAHSLNRIEEMNDIAMIALTTADITQAKAEGRVAIILGTQNSTLVEGDFSLLSILQRIGFRILQPTYNEQNHFGDGAIVAEDEGLTGLGRKWIHEMNRQHMVIDLSHSGYRTCADAIAESSQPVVFSHANALALCNNPRNKPDELIRAVAEKGGTTGAVCWAPLLKHATRPTIEDYLDQVEYIVNLAGIEHVSFASDLTEGRTYSSPEEFTKLYGPNGIYSAITGMMGDWYNFDQRFTEGFESLAHTPRIWDGLVKRGYSEDGAEKIMGRNLLRVFQEVWGA